MDNQSPPKPDQIIEYKQVDNVSLKLHVFSPSGDKTANVSPAIIFFHGGGWNGGSPEQFYRQSRHLAAKGMVAISAQYRIANKHGTRPAEAVKDGKSAIRWVRRHASQLGVDPDRLGAGGGSAGGHIAAATALTAGFNDPDDDLSIDCHPNALVLFNPVIDNGPEGYGYERVKDYWEVFSPLHNIDDEAPPTLILHGTDDHHIPVSTMQRYKHFMEEAGVRCDLVLYQGQGHGFFNVQRYTATLEEMENFLRSIGYLANG